MRGKDCNEMFSPFEDSCTHLSVTAVQELKGS